VTDSDSIPNNFKTNLKGVRERDFKGFREKDNLKVANTSKAMPKSALDKETKPTRTQDPVPSDTRIPQDVGQVHTILLERLDKFMGGKQSNKLEVTEVAQWIDSHPGGWGPAFRKSLDQMAVGAKYPTLLHHILAYSKERSRTLKFNKRGVLARYLMREYPSLYYKREKKPHDGGGEHHHDSDNEGVNSKGEDEEPEDDAEDDEEDDEKTPLYLALTKAINIDKKNPGWVTLDPFLQLFVEENPEETAKQFGSWYTDGNREGTRLHDLIPRIWPWLPRPDTVGPRCMVKLLPRLGPNLLASENTDSEGNTVLHLVARHSLRLANDKNEIAPELPPDLLEEIMHMIDRCPTVINTKNSSSQSPYLYRVQCAREKALTCTLDDQLTFYLKKRCIASSYDPEEAVQQLYGSDSSAQRTLG